MRYSSANISRFKFRMGQTSCQTTMPNPSEMYCGLGSQMNIVRQKQLSTKPANLISKSDKHIQLSSAFRNMEEKKQRPYEDEGVLSTSPGRFWSKYLWNDSSENSGTRNSSSRSKTQYTKCLHYKFNC